MDMRGKNLRDMTPSQEGGRDVRDTKQLSGVAKDSLHGKNELTQYKTSDGKGSGPWGGKAAYK